MGDGRGGHLRLVLPGAGGEPGLVVLDVAAPHLRQAGHLGRGLGEERGERAQRQVSAADTAWPQHAADLGQVTAHRGRDLRDDRLQPGPARQDAHPVGPPRRRPVHRLLPGTAPPGGMTGENLRVDHLCGLAVLRREPVTGQVQVDPGGLDRGMPGLGLHRLQRHPSFAEPGQARVPQLMAGRMLQASPPPCRSQDLIHPPDRQRLPAARSLQDHKHPVASGARRPLALQVGGHRGEEPARHRDQPLPATLALGNEHPPLRGVQVTQPQPENLTAAQPTEHHRRDHRPVPVRAQRRGQPIHLSRRQDPRQLAGDPHQRDTLMRAGAFPPGRQPPRHRVRRHIPAGLQEREKPGHDRQAPAHRDTRHPAGLTPRTHRLQHTTPARAAGPLRGDERQHISRLDLLRRLGHHREEHLQVIRGRPHRVRPAPPAQELQIHIGQRHPNPGNQATATVTRTDRAQIPSMHSRLPSSQTTTRQGCPK